MQRLAESACRLIARRPITDAHDWDWRACPDARLAPTSKKPPICPDPRSFLTTEMSYNRKGLRRFTAAASVRNATASVPGVQRLIKDSTNTNDIVKPSFVVARRQYNVNGVHIYIHESPRYFSAVGECCLETANFLPKSKLQQLLYLANEYVMNSVRINDYRGYRAVVQSLQILPKMSFKPWITKLFSTYPYSLFTPPTRTRQNCLVLSCPCRRCEQAIRLL